MSDRGGVLFVPYQDTLALLSVADALRICEDVYGMHARGSVVWSSPASIKLDVADGFNNHWHVKSALLKDIPATGVRLYNYYDDGVRNTVGDLGCTRYIALSDPYSGEPVAIVDEHWSYAIRSAAAATLACKWMGPRQPKILGLVGIGTMGTNALRCLCSMYKFEEIRCTSRRPETRAAFARKWSQALGIAVVPKDSIEEVVIDSWDFNMLQGEFRRMVESGQFAREQLYGEIHELVSGEKKGRERDDERILIHTTGLVSQDIALAHFLYRSALDKGLGTWLPRAGGAACAAGAGGRSTT